MKLDRDALWEKHKEYAEELVGSEFISRKAFNAILDAIERQMGEPVAWLHTFTGFREATVDEKADQYIREHSKPLYSSESSATDQASPSVASSSVGPDRSAEQERETPRTEAMIDSCGDYEKAYHYKGRFADFARQLERELSQAREQIAEWVTSNANCAIALERAEELLLDYKNLYGDPPKKFINAALAAQRKD